MDPNKKKSLSLKAKRVIENLAKRNITGMYVDSCREACDAVRQMIPKNSLVGLGGSTTLIESGILNTLREMEIRLLDRYSEGISSAEIHEMRHKGLTADVFLASANAITLDGRLVNEDGIGNRVAAMCFGPPKVIIVAGVNKIVNDVEEGVRRIKTIAAPANCLRFGTDTPCSRTGVCDDDNCRPPTRICSQICIIENDFSPDRIHVILIGEELGF